MIIRKMPLLASMALAAIAFAVPAAQAAAPEWHTHPGNVTLAGEKVFFASGEISSIGGGPLTNGPCELEFTGTAKNVTGMAAGQVEGAIVLKTPCPTNLPGCTVIPVFSNFNWPITGIEVTGEPGLQISGTTFTNKYSAFCQSQYGIPKEVSTTGTATTIVVGTECLSFEGHDDDLVIENAAKEDTAAGVNLEGGICVENLTLN
jgi:hypothetical protein